MTNPGKNARNVIISPNNVRNSCGSTSFMHNFDVVIELSDKIFKNSGRKLYHKVQAHCKDYGIMQSFFNTNLKSSYHEKV